MNAPEAWLLPDAQTIADRRNVYINRVGAKSLLHPLRIASPGGVVSTVAAVDMAVVLPPQLKGTHMSHFVEVPQQHDEVLDAESGMIEMHFPYFISKRAPAGAVFTTRVSAPATSLCSCSKEISDYGAHNQRSHIAGIAEQEASCEFYGRLKRLDEKYVTERAYDNPKSVEDLVRDIALRLDADARVRGHAVEAENFESIHNHSACALVERVE